MMRHLFKLFSLPSVLVSSLLVLTTLSLRRTIGPPNDARFITAAQACNGNDRKEFEFGMCSLLIVYVYEKIDEAFKASFSSDTNIAWVEPS